ncbi:hypothetical protein [Pedosphaera parvula]|uniref:Uncharacterized protein n=1 Tax=Pedosphaera parvula (strain Ellin514) TaxID=320771 RepID=B9XMM7_PEDPL|nr:hypothetical protein [Pedosphaera parvula]EEF58926.1 hypothetical protein Cflav_PD2928 [Pedosphaera parvula Ellin514]
MSGYIIYFVGGLFILLCASIMWAQIDHFVDQLTGSTRIRWYRRLFWRQTVEDLMAELQAGKRTEISGEEVELAKAYQRRRMASDIRFPKAGEIYEAIGDFEVHYMTAHCAPFTGGGRSILPKGERVRVCEPSNPEPLCVYCDPLSYEALHERIVSAEERAHERYEGYYFNIDTVDLNRFFRFVESSKTDEETNKHAG